MIYNHKRKISSIGEDKALLKKRINDGLATQKEIRKFNRLKGLSETKNVFGKVFVTKAMKFGDPARNKNKHRRVVAIKANDSGMILTPVTRANTILGLSRFDGDRLINVNQARKISFDEVFEKRKFPKTGNDFLTRDEKRQLLRKTLRLNVGGGKANQKHSKLPKNRDSRRNSCKRK